MPRDLFLTSVFGKSVQFFMCTKAYQILCDDKAYQYHSNAAIPYVLERSGDFLRIVF